MNNSEYLEYFEKFKKLAEYPFLREDMTPQEFEEEYLYLAHNYDSVKNGTYKPLWKQRMEHDKSQQ